MSINKLKVVTRYEIKCKNGIAVLVLDHETVWGLRWEPYDQRRPYFNNAFHPYMKDETHQQQLQRFCNYGSVWIEESEASQVVALFTEIAKKGTTNDPT